jgi:AcrR family transcriptional regulator
MGRPARRKQGLDQPASANPGGSLDVAAWVSGAMQVLTERGIDGVRVEILAKKLGVTKGSFYWHFADRGALLTEMLQTWRKRATLGIIERLESTREPAATRLRRLLRLQFDTHNAEIGAEIELAIRMWARHDEQAAKALREVDDLRLRYIAKLLEELGASKKHATARAMLIYCYMRVSRTLADPVADESIIRSCESILLGETTA